MLLLLMLMLMLMLPFKPSAILEEAQQEECSS
jgi:hypothetical protein